MKIHNRRQFLKTAALGSIAMMALPQIVSAAWKFKPKNKIKLKRGQTILFQGDSITDAGRNRDITDANNPSALGSGYVFLTSAALLRSYPQESLRIYNKGVSGDKVYMLAERWDRDCIALKPDVLSVLVGVNDFWHTLSFGYKATVRTYETDYRKLLLDTKQQFPDIHLVICEPFAVKGTSVVSDNWFPDFEEYRVVSQNIANEFKATFIPMQSIYNEAIKYANGAYWAYDGVHPTMAGAQLMAEAWRQIIE